MNVEDLIQKISSSTLNVNEDPIPHLTPNEKLELCKSFSEEIVQEEELVKLFSATRPLIAYDGFEPSGRMHIAQGLLKTIIVNKLSKCGVNFVFWVADWFALLNNKLEGDIEKIQAVGRYMIEVWKAAGMNMSSVQFLWSSEEILKRPNEYWSLVFDIARKNSLKRVMRCTQIMGRSESDDLCASQIFYPVMQCADIFFLKADICQLGMDQRKVNMLAREYCDAQSSRTRPKKPVILSHHMMMGLGEGQEKMSKSIPDSAIFMEDSPAEVNAKIKKAFCPYGVIEKNPVLDYYKHIVFPLTPIVEIKSKNIENEEIIKEYSEYDKFEQDFKEDIITPKDIKSYLAFRLNELLKPIRDHFETDPEAKALLEKIKKFSVTR